MTGVVSKGNNNVICVVTNCQDNSSLVITCYYCSNSVHVACLLCQCKETITKTPKVGAEWISEFISFSHVKYVCFACHEVHKNSTLITPLNSASAFTQNGFALTAPSRGNIDLNLLYNQVNDIQSEIADMKASLNQLNYTYAARNNHQLVSSLATEQLNSLSVANQQMSSSVSHMPLLLVMACMTLNLPLPNL